MSESLASSDPGAQKRRSTRITQAVPITVTGVDALGQPFKERTTTVMVNCHGCKYQSKHYVPKNSVVALEVPRNAAGLAPRTVQGRVIWVQRPRTVRELFQIGLEFEVAGNIWGIAFPPEDWFPHPDDVPPEPVAEPSKPEARSVDKPPQEGSIPTFEITPEPAPPAQAAAGPPGAAQTPASSEGKIHVVPSPPQGAGQPPPPSPADVQGAQLAVARQMARMVAEAKEALDKNVRRNAQAAINDEMTVVRQHLDAQLHEAVERAIKVSMERASESAAKKVVQQAAERTAAIVEEARKATGADVARLDAKIREAVGTAVSGAADQAARQAAEQATAQNLKQSVELAVERVIAEREASSPSLQILSSPEAAQAQLDQWKKNLEEAAQSTHAETLERAQAEIAAASQRLQQELDESSAAATENIRQKIADSSQSAIAQAERDFADRSVDLRASLDQALAGAQGAVQAVTNEAQHTVQSLTAALEEERTRAEATQKALQQQSQTTVDLARVALDQLLTTQKDEIARATDAVIAERTQHIEPVLQNSAQKVLDHFSAELDQKLSPQLNQTQQAIADLNRAAEQAAQVRGAIEQQVREASEKTIAESVERLRQEAAKVPVEMEETVRATISKAERELEQRASETQHETYEALLKASDWYQKKAHTTMQAALEKAVEQSTSALRDNAAEISSLAASELDHQRRAYVNHAQGQIEEGAKEVVDRERGKLVENAEIASATFANRVNHVTSESFKRFEEASRATLEKARSDMEFVREGSLTEYQGKLDERILEGIEQARIQLQSQLVPMMEEWDAQRESEKRVWMEQVKKNTEESIEHYKGRLENASNSWLLASAATLGQNSQAMLDALAKAAEKRIRESCADVLAGMGDTIKERLLGISTGFSPAEDSEALPPAPPKKKA